MKKTLFLILIGMIAVNGFAQNTFSKTGDSDPAATAVLDKVRAKFESYKTLKTTFTLKIKFPEEPEDIQKGTMIQEGDKYRLTFPSQVMVSDGETLWLHLVDDKEVQINDVEEAEGEFLSPSSMLRFYESEEFVYALTNELAEGGKVVQQIEFKSLDPDSEYAKVRLTVDKKTHDAVRIEAFGKDGSRYTLIMGKLTVNQAVTADTFKYGKSDCPDCHFEDLRF